IEATPEGVSWLGLFYAGNTAGAVVGSLAAGFYLLSVFDVSVATYVAAALNVVVAVSALALASGTTHEALPPGAAPGLAQRAFTVYLAIGLSGLTALACEVIWTRLLSLLLGGSVYAFSLILAVFLLGLGLGSSFGSLLVRSVTRARVALGCCQIALAAAMAWTAWVLTQSLPYWPINPSLSPNVWFQFQLDLVRCLYAVLPGAVLWGASFPLALASVASREEDSGRPVGGVYAANTLGAIIGSLAASLILVVWIGSQRAEQLLIMISALSGLMLLLEARIPAL